MNQHEVQLPEEPAIADFQVYIAAIVRARGFDQRNIAQLFLLFFEECGELAHAIRSDADKAHIAHELADISMYLCDISNYFAIDLERAVRQRLYDFKNCGIENADELAKKSSSL